MYESEIKTEDVPRIKDVEGLSQTEKQRYLDLIAKKLATHISQCLNPVKYIQSEQASEEGLRNREHNENELKFLKMILTDPLEAVKMLKITKRAFETNDPAFLAGLFGDKVMTAGEAKVAVDEALKKADKTESGIKIYLRNKE